MNYKLKPEKSTQIQKKNSPKSTVHAGVQQINYDVLTEVIKHFERKN